MRCTCSCCAALIEQASTSTPVSVMILLHSSSARSGNWPPPLEVRHRPLGLRRRARAGQLHTTCRRCPQRNRQCTGTARAAGHHQQVDHLRHTGSGFSPILTLRTTSSSPLRTVADGASQRRSDHSDCGRRADGDVRRELPSGVAARRPRRAGAPDSAVNGTSRPARPIPAAALPYRPIARACDPCCSRLVLS